MRTAAIQVASANPSSPDMELPVRAGSRIKTSFLLGTRRMASNTRTSQGRIAMIML
jgi:hypothetical protein